MNRLKPIYIGMIILAAISIIAAGVSLIFSGDAAAYDFKGVHVGQPATPESIREALGVSCGEGYPGSQVCNGTQTIAGAVARMNLVIGVSGNVQRIMLVFPSQDYGHVEAAMLEKFGPPTEREESVVQNRLGATFDQVHSHWIGDGVYISMSRLSADITESNVVFYSQEQLERDAYLRAQRERDL